MTICGFFLSGAISATVGLSAEFCTASSLLT